MSRIPASLLYLAVYNPLIRAVLPDSGNGANDDEDAEEQAQILFYTARERAVSRDRMLRQVGLAKALVNFTEMFNPTGEPCQSVHSQTRRMVMISPEPDYWIYACVELPKTPRPPPSTKSKKNEKVDKGKQKEVIYDYQDGNVHDNALRTHLLRGYEQFKLRHGSFATIMASLGQQALELQLERFFTVWAWMWDIEDEMEFGEHLGIPLHPSYKLLTSHFDALNSLIPPDAVPFLFSASGLIPSSTFNDLNMSTSVVRHLLSLIPSLENVHTLADDAVGNSDMAKEASLATSNTLKDIGTGAQATGRFLVMPNMSMPAMPMPNMDVRKWTWPGYLTFRKSAGGKGMKSSKADEEQKAPDPVSVGQEDNGSKLNASIRFDAQSLHEAMMTDGLEPAQDDSFQTVASTETCSISSSRTVISRSLTPPGVEVEENAAEDNDGPSTSLPFQPDSAPSQSELSESNNPPILSSMYIHLSDSNTSSETKKRRLVYLRKDGMTFGMVDGKGSGMDDNASSMITPAIVTLMDNISDAIVEERHKSGTETPVTAAQILQPKDSYIFSLGDVMLRSSSGFKSTSGSLYTCQQLLQCANCDIVEVFCRGQNPQHWHVSRRGLGVDEEGNTMKGEIYLESTRKESSLADVDNEILAAIRRFSTK